MVEIPAIPVPGRLRQENRVASLGYTVSACLISSNLISQL
jgi:hypothetical protein